MMLTIDRLQTRRQEILGGYEVDSLDGLSDPHGTNASPPRL